MGYKSVNPSPLLFSFKRSDSSQVPYSIAKLSIYPVLLFYKKRSFNYNKGMYELVKKRWNCDSTMIEESYLRFELSIYLSAKLLVCCSSFN